MFRGDCDLLAGACSVGYWVFGVWNDGEGDA